MRKYLIISLLLVAGCGNMSEPNTEAVGNSTAISSMKPKLQPYEKLDSDVRQYEAVHGKADIQPYMLAPETLTRRLTPMESFKLERQMRQFYLKQNKPYPKDMDGKIFKQEFTK